MNQEHVHDQSSTAPCIGCGELFCEECIDDHIDACAQRCWDEYRQEQDPYGWFTTHRPGESLNKMN